MNVNLVIEPNAPEALKEVVRKGVISHNVAATSSEDPSPVCIFLKTEHQEVVGGVLGYIWAQCLYISFLWVDTPLRHKGHGTALLQTAEKLAAERACTIVQLETFSFQVPEFYAKRGYETIAILDDYPPGHKKYFFKKFLPTVS